MHNEKVLLSAFEKTSFLVCLRPDVPTLSSQCTAQTAATSDHTLEAWGCGNHASIGWAGGETMQSCTIPTHLRESETVSTWRHAAANSSIIAAAAASASQSPRAPMSTAGPRFERKLTGVASEDSTARPSTESATDSEPIQVHTHLTDPVQLDGIAIRTCVKYLRIGGHQPMDILRHPIVQDALQVRKPGCL